MGSGEGVSPSPAGVGRKFVKFLCGNNAFLCISDSYCYCVPAVNRAPLNPPVMPYTDFGQHMSRHCSQAMDLRLLFLKA